MKTKYSLACFLLLLSSVAGAHPHSFIHTKTVIEGTETNITGFKMVWTFDAMTTAYLFDGEDLSPQAKEASFQALADSIIENMKNEHYFTYFYDHNTPIRFKVVKTGHMYEKNNEAILSFELPLSHPQPLLKDGLRLLIFDPSYYVDMSWKANSDIELSDSLASQCTYKIIEPHPTTEQMNYAMSLSMDADPDNTLGQLFTQEVRLECK